VRDFFGESILSGSMLVALPVALLGGLISFFSPCVLPLLPGYLSYATGVSGADLAAGTARRGRLVLGSSLFVLGLVAVMVLIGSLFGALGAAGEQLNLHQRQITFWMGFFVIAMGLLFAGLLPGLGFLQRDLRVHKVPAVGLAAAPVLGFLFGLGWTPCIGPTLSAIQTLSWQSEASATRGAVLSAVFGLGLGLPFIAAGFAYERMLGAFGWVRRHQVWVMRAGGLMLVIVGVAMVTGWYDWAVQWVQNEIVSNFRTVA
jgi:cytochrome c-type biogenesis protein